MEIVSFLKELFSIFYRYHSSLKLGSKSPDLAAFLSAFSSIPSNIAPFVERERLDHNLATFSKFS